MGIAHIGGIRPLPTSSCYYLRAERIGGGTCIAPIPRMLYAMDDAGLAVVGFRVVQPAASMQTWRQVRRRGLQV